MENTFVSPKGTFCSIFLLWGAQVAPAASVAITTIPRRLGQALRVRRSQGHRDRHSGTWMMPRQEGMGCGTPHGTLLLSACAGQVGTSVEPTPTHPTCLQAGQSFHCTPQILFFFFKPVVLRLNF